MSQSLPKTLQFNRRRRVNLEAKLVFYNGFYEQAFRPVPQENLSFVERAEEPVLENGAKCEL